MRRVAIFDFDDTLVLGDSFFPFLICAVGRARTWLALLGALAVFAFRRARGDRSISLRTFVKGYLLRALLKGMRRDALCAAAEKMRGWVKVNEPIMRKLKEHSAKGDVVVIASGGLDLYLPELLRDVPYNALICTDVGVEKGVVTAEMIKGNCVRVRKAKRLAKWLEENGPFDESFGYGNYPHDIPMLNLVKHRVIVS